jgi:hypothetical protein
MSIALANARILVRDLLDEDVAQFWSDAQLNRWLNEGCADTQRRVEWKQSQASLNVIPETQKYPAPDDVQRIHRVEFNPSPSAGNNQNTYTLEYRGLMEMDQVWGINQQWPATYPLYYTLWGQPGIGTLQIITFPVPSQAGTMFVWYYPVTVTASTDTTNLDIAQGFEDMIVDYCMYRALRRDADPRWQDAKKDYEDKIMALNDSSRTWQDQSGTFTTGQQALPQWLTSSEGW